MPQVVIAAAAAIGTAITTTLGASAAAAAIGAAAANAVAALGFAQGIMAGVSAWATVAAIGSAAFAKKPKIGGMGEGGTQVDFKANPNAGVPLVIGRTGTGGVIAHMTTNGQAYKNSHLLSLVVLSLGPIQGLDGFTMNATPVTVVADHVTTGVYAGATDLRLQVGAEPEGPFLIGSVIPAATPEWTDDHKLSGLAAVWYNNVYNVVTFPTGLPKPLWTVLGPAVYDPRADSTYPGGSGAQRADDPSTWSFVGNDNPFLQALTWLLGHFTNGVRVMGVGLPVSRIDVPAFVEGANVADANAWTCGGIVTSTDRKWDVFAAMLQAGSGLPLRLGGMVSCVVDTPRVSLATITGADLIGEATVTGTKSRRERFNRVVPRYRSEDHGWEVVPAAPVQVDAYIAEDGGQRTQEFEFALCQNVDQAAQLATYQIVNAREAEPIVLPLKPAWVGFKGGDCLTVDEPELGLNGQKVLVIDRQFDPATAGTTLSVRTETDAKHPYALGKTGTPPPTPSLTGVDAAFVGAVGEGAWIFTGETIAGAGMSIPALLIVGAVDDENAREVLVRYRPAGGGDWTDTVSAAASATRFEITGVTAGDDYEAEITYRSNRGVVGAWLSLGTATAGEFDLGDLGTAISDGALSPGEKVYVVPIIKSLIAARASLRDRADALNLLIGNNLERLAYETAADDLDAQLVALNASGPVDWDDPSDLTLVDDPAALTAALTDSLTSERNLQGAVDVAYATKISDIDAAQIALADDGILSPKDKFALVPQINKLIAARATLRSRATAMGLTVALGNVERIAFENAATAFDATLAGLTLPVPWNNTTGNTTIASPGSFSGQFQSCLQTEILLQTKIDGEPTGGAFGVNLTEGTGGATALLAAFKTALGTAAAFSGQGALATLNAANWTTQIGGSGKPADFADVTATHTAAGFTGQGLWATYTVLSPANVSSRILYLDTNGQIFDQRGMPLNTPIGYAGGRANWPLTSNDNSITVTGYTDYRTGTNLSIPSGTITGLSPGTQYDCFYFTSGGFNFAIGIAGSYLYMIDQQNYVYLGRQATKSSGVYVPAPAAPGGSSGGGSRGGYNISQP